MILSTVQYAIYLICGFLLFLMIATIFGVAAGFGRFALLLLFSPLFLFGYVSGLSFLRPRSAAVMASALVLPFLGTGIYDFCFGTPASEPALFIIPSAAVIAVSTIVVLCGGKAIQREHSLMLKVVIGILAAVPAVLATWSLVSIILFLASFTAVPSQQ